MIVCIPAYNEGPNLACIIQKARIYASEVIVYDDGSKDNTSEVAKNSGATVIRGTNNQGYGAAINRLFHIAKSKNADMMVTMDSDGQHDPGQIPIVLEVVEVEVSSSSSSRS